MLIYITINQNQTRFNSNLFENFMLIYDRHAYGHLCLKVFLLGCISAWKYFYLGVFLLESISTWVYFCLKVFLPKSISTWVYFCLKVVRNPTKHVAIETNNLRSFWAFLDLRCQSLPNSRHSRSPHYARKRSCERVPGPICSHCSPAGCLPWVRALGASPWSGCGPPDRPFGKRPCMCPLCLIGRPPPQMFSSQNQFG